MRLRKAVENKMLPHFLVMFQWILLVIILVFNLNSSVTVTGAVANSGYKVIMFFNVWMLFIPGGLFLIFCRIRKEGIVEKYIAALLMITLFFSTANVALHFMSDLVPWMKATEVVAWSLYNIIFSLSMYKVSIVVLPPILRSFSKWKERNFETVRDEGLG